MIDYTFSYEALEYFLLIFVRVASFVYIVPFFNMSQVPGRVRIALSLVLAALLYGVLGGTGAVEYTNVYQYAGIVLKEAVAGILIGMGVNLSSAILSLTGAVADMEVGLAMVTLLDPATKQQTTITSTLYQYLIMMILILTGMYEYIIGALAESFTLIPINGMAFRMDKLLNAAIQFMAEYIFIGFQICFPIFAAILLLNAVLGIMAKVSPQMNMFAVGLQLKILVGFGVILATVALLPVASELIFTQAKKMTVLFVEALM